MPLKLKPQVGNAQDHPDALRERLSTITEAYSRFVPRQFLNLLGIEARMRELQQQNRS